MIPGTRLVAMMAVVFGLAASQPASARADETKLIRIGVIGLDTSHAIAFTEAFNDPKAEGDLAGFRVVAAYPRGSRDIASSVERVPQYTQKMQSMGVQIVDSIEALLPAVDVVLLESNDGRVHLEQILPVLQAGKPVFVDKPVAASLADAVAIYRAAAHYSVPVFSSSALRYTPGAQAIRGGKLGAVLGANTYSPASLEPSHPDLYWYGIHGVETLFTVMGTGCESVVRAHSEGADVVVGTWSGGRIGTFRGTRSGAAGYGGTAFGEKGVEAIGAFAGYKPLVVEIARFFRSGKLPVDPAETIEIYAFMSAADESKKRGGAPVTLEEVIKEAQNQAEMKLASLLK